MSVRLLVADDNEVVRIGVRTLIGNNPDWQICGEATNGREAIAKVRELAPDVVILDLTMPVMNGFQAAVEIRRIASSTKIVFFLASTTFQPPPERLARMLSSQNLVPHRN